jgi:hypothetical protein
MLICNVHKIVKAVIGVTADHKVMCEASKKLVLLMEERPSYDINSCAGIPDIFSYSAQVMW